MMEAGDRAYLGRQLAEGRIVLFTGAGFSLGAKDSASNPMPSGRDVARELWELCFPREDFDEGSSLQDLFGIALSKNATALRSYLQTRFCVERGSLQDHHRIWLSGPWVRIYTLNVDDVELAANQQFDLPRRLISISALEPPRIDSISPPHSVEVIHLNGCASSGPEAVTFSTSQYGKRIGGSDPYYPQFVSDLLVHPCIFVGTPLDEGPLWQHIELRGLHGGRYNRELRRKSFLVTPTLSRARQALLKEYNIVWIPMRADDFARDVFVELKGEIDRGLARIHAASTGASSRPEIPLVAELADESPPSAKSLYLLGDEPSWTDISSGQAILRTSDSEILQKCKALLDSARKEASPSKAGTLLAITGTAGSGKSTALMRLALRLTADGEEIGWIDDSIDVGPRQIERFPDDRAARLLFIDNAERYGNALPAVARSLLNTKRLDVLVVGMRANHIESFIRAPGLFGTALVEASVPPLTDADIDALLEILDKSNLLGKLKGRPRIKQREAFEKKAGRQLLVAMLEATSEAERFERKVYDEWLKMSPLEQGDVPYAVDLRVIEVAVSRVDGSYAAFC